MLVSSAASLFWDNLHSDEPASIEFVRTSEIGGICPIGEVLCLLLHRVKMVFLHKIPTSLTATEHTFLPRLDKRCFTYDESPFDDHTPFIAHKHQVIAIQPVIASIA